MIGAAPNTSWLSGLVELDRAGFVRTGVDVGASSSFATSCPGVFAVGDVRSGSVKRVASSVGEGSVVVSAIWSHVNAPPPAAMGIGG
jgi:thioredoxin reductase (NADPH)